MTAATAVSGSAVGDTDRFRYDGFDFDATSGVLLCHYGHGEMHFTERIDVGRGSSNDAPAAEAAARLVYLLAGVSYYKTAAPPVVDTGRHALTPAERRLLEATYRDGLGEFALQNDIDLGGLRIEGPEREPHPSTGTSEANRPLVPFGGGIDSIVTVEGVRQNTDDVHLFVVSRGGDRFAAIEAPLAVTGLPVLRAERSLDPQVLRSHELGFLNGHVPVTGIISAIAVLVAVRSGCDAVIMSNEWSSSAGNVERHGRMVNHQWSKSLEFEELFRAAVRDSIPTPVEYFSWLRPFSELWVARRFSELEGYRASFRSCNRAFHLDPSQRLDHWCGRCDKCAFVDLVLAPFMDRDRLVAVFDGNEPLEDEGGVDRLRGLLGLGDHPKPFECVGDVDECRVALLLASQRSDRAGNRILATLADELGSLVPGDPASHLDRLTRPLGPHHVPLRHAPPDLLV